MLFTLNATWASQRRILTIIKWVSIQTQLSKTQKNSKTVCRLYGYLFIYFWLGRIPLLHPEPRTSQKLTSCWFMAQQMVRFIISSTHLGFLIETSVCFISHHATWLFSKCVHKWTMFALRETWALAFSHVV